MKTGSKLANYIFNAAVACLLTHELDAMTHHEWRLLLPFLGDESGRFVFVLAHIPLFFLTMIWHSSSTETRSRFRIGLSIFMVLHSVAHYTFSQFHPGYTFGPPIETITVHGAGALGVAYLGLWQLERARR